MRLLMLYTRALAYVCAYMRVLTHACIPLSFGSVPTYPMREMFRSSSVVFAFGQLRASLRKTKGSFLVRAAQDEGLVPRTRCVPSVDMCVCVCCSMLYDGQVPRALLWIRRFTLHL